MSTTLKGYKKRLETRRTLAHKIGRGGFYQAKDGLLPKPFWTLLRLLKRGGANETNRNGR